jgi:hypothetical protein
MVFNKREFRADVRRVLLSGHGVTIATASREQLANAVNQTASMQMGFYADADQFHTAVQNAVRDMFRGKK